MKADEARDICSFKKDAFLRTLGLIRQMCDSEIREACISGRDSIEFSVPRAVMGEDGYNQAEMGRTLAQELYEDRYSVTGCAKRLNISWRDAASEIVRSDPPPARPKAKQIYKEFLSPKCKTRPTQSARKKNGKVEVSLNVK